MKNENVKLMGNVFALDFGSEMYKREDVLRVAQNHGLDVTFFPKPTKGNSFKNALKKEFSTKKDAGQVLNFVEETENAIIFQVDEKILVERNIFGTDSDGFHAEVKGNSASFREDYHVIFDKESERVISSRHELVSTVYDLLGVFQENYTKSTLRRYVLKLLEKNTSFVQYIKGSGVYFVPIEETAFMEKIIKFTKELDENSFCVVTEIGAYPNAKETLKLSVSEKFEEDSKKIESEILELIEKQSSMTKKAFDNRLEKLAKNAKVVEQYEVLLESQLEKVRDTSRATEKMLKTYYMFGKLENPFEELLSKAKGEEELELLREEVPDEILELIDM